MTRWFVASGGGTSMLFGVSAEDVITWASPKMLCARGWQLSTLRDLLSAKRCAFYELAVPPGFKPQVRRQPGPARKPKRRKKR
jgi:hypothetical protein